MKIWGDPLIVIYICIILLSVFLDQLFKYLAVINLQPVGKITAIPYVLDFVYVENKGIAFGMFKDSRLLFIITTLIVIVIFTVLLVKSWRKSKLFSLSAALIIGGGIGNLIDRIRLSYVIDYLQLSFFGPVCNFADYCITAGTIMLIVYLLFFSNMDKKKKELR